MGKQKILKKSKDTRQDEQAKMDHIVAAAIMKQCESVSHIIKSLSHPVRLKIMCQLIEGEKTVNELTEFCKISQSAMSQFLTRLKIEGMLISRREGHFVFYSVKDVKLSQLLRAIKEIYC